MYEFTSEAEFRKWFEKPSVYQEYGIEKILWSQNGFPDLKVKTILGRVILAEVELKTSNFDLHGHDEDQVDLVIVWLHDEPYRKRHFKVYDVSLNMASKAPIPVDKVVDSEEDLVCQRVNSLPLIAVSSSNADDFQLIKRYMKAWKIINQQDVERFFTSDLGELVEEFKTHVEVSKCDFLNRTKHFDEGFRNRAFHPILCAMAKAIVIRGTLQLIKEGVLPLQSPHNDPVTNVYSVSKDHYVGLQRLERKHKLPFAIGDFPFFSYEERNFFCTDLLDAFVDNFNFRTSNGLPAVEIGLTLQELTVWDRFGKKALKEKEALGQYGLKETRFSRDEFNPMKLEFSPSRVVSFSSRLASKLKEYGFVEPAFSKEIVRRLYDFVIQPIGVITQADKMPSVDDIEFFFYPQSRVEDMLRRAETTIGLKRQDGVKYLKEFYQKYPSRFNEEQFH
jgi:hypothetical protein